MSYVEIDNVVKRYGQGEGSVEALKGISLTIEQAEFVAVMGPSGCGKSTLLSVLGALAAPSSGGYSVDEIDICSLSRDQLADFRREYLGFVFQNFNLIPYLSLAENVMLPLATKSMKTREKRELAQEALLRVGLGNKGHRLPNQVSGGEQERAAIARAVVNLPPILLADEPTGNLDATTSREVMDLLSRLSGEGTTIVMVTHNEECASYAGRTVRMCDGGIADCGIRLRKAAASA